MKKSANMEDLLEQSLEDLYDAEKQIAEALPKMMAAASSQELSSAFANHLEETKAQITRLEEIFERIAVEPGRSDCKPMQALIAEADRLIRDFEKSPVLDTALIGAARKVEHYEFAGYSAALSIAETLSQQDAFNLLHDTLDEEIEAEAALEELGEALLSGDAMAVEEIEETELDEEEEEEEEIEKGSHGRES